MCRLAGCFLKMDQSQTQQINNCEISNRFLFLQKFFQGILYLKHSSRLYLIFKFKDKLRINENINYNLAKEGNNFELGKVNDFITKLKLKTIFYTFRFHS